MDIIQLLTVARPEQFFYVVDLVVFEMKQEERVGEAEVFREDVQDCKCYTWSEKVPAVPREVARSYADGALA